MDKIKQSLIYLDKQIREVEALEQSGHFDNHAFLCGLKGERRGMLYALEMMGCRFRYTNVEKTEADITTAEPRAALGND